MTPPPDPPAEERLCASPDVADIQPHHGVGGIKFRATAASCEHAWELHLWEHGRAYCPKCGSFAKALNDPRMSP